MGPLIAEQLIYTNVLENYSPSKQSGYQTVCTSPGLSTEDCRAIEKRIAGPPEAPPDVVRWQWFPLSGGRRVLTRSQYFPIDPEISDPRGGGAYLVHALVLASSRAGAFGG